MKWRKTLLAAFLGMTMMTGSAFDRFLTSMYAMLRANWRTTIRYF